MSRLQRRCASTAAALLAVFAIFSTTSAARAQTCAQRIQQSQAYVNYIQNYCGDPRIGATCDQMRAYIRETNRLCRTNIPVPGNPGGGGGGSGGGGSGGSGGTPTCSLRSVMYYRLTYTGPSSGTIENYCCRSVAESNRAAYQRQNPRYRFTVTALEYRTYIGDSRCQSRNTIYCTNGVVRETPLRGSLYSWGCN